MTPRKTAAQKAAPRPTTRNATAEGGATAQKAEALEETIQFDYDGHTYTMARDYGLDAMEALEDNKWTVFFRRALSATDYAEFRKNHSSREHIYELLGAYSDVIRAKNS